MGGPTVNLQRPARRRQGSGGSGLARRLGAQVLSHPRQCRTPPLPAGGHRERDNLGGASGWTRALPDTSLPGVLVPGGVS
jgi:hypothetical protein